MELEEFLDWCRRYPRARLPSVREMAVQLGCPLRQMRMLVARGRLRGALVSAPGRGVRVVSAHQTTRDDPTHWRRVYHALRTDIAMARLQPDTFLPSVKELRDRFGCGRRNCTAALRALVSCGLAVAAGRRYRVTRLSARFPSGVILHMGGGLEYGVSATLFERSRDCLRLLDAQAVVHNVILQPYPLQFDVLRTTTVEHFRQKLSRVCGNRPLLGVSVWGIGIADRVVWRLVHELLDPGLRVALYDDTPRTTTSSPVKRTALPFRRFAVSDAVTVGGAAAEHVIAHGHRVIAWISHAPGESWSVARLSGIRSRCREFPGVRVVDGGGPDISKWNVTTLPAVREKIAATLFDGARIPDTMALHNMLDTLSVAYRDCLFETRFVDSVRPLFERLLAMQPRPTVWICSSDALAAHAHDFLRERGMAVPRDISLVGFDDSLDSFHRGIDSYNFNNHGAALAILTHILDPNRSNELWGQRIDIPIEGFVHTRGSVRDIRGR